MIPSPLPGDQLGTDPAPDQALGDEIAATGPEFYEQGTAARPGTALFDLAGPAQEKLQEALALLHRAEHAATQLDASRAMPSEIDEWTYTEQQAQHEQLAASIADRAASLAAFLEQIVSALSSAEAYVGRLAAPRFAKYAARLTPIIQMVSELVELSALLPSRITRAEDDLRDRAEVCADYQAPTETLYHARELIDDVNDVAISLKEGLDWLQQVK